MAAAGSRVNAVARRITDRDRVRNLANERQAFDNNDYRMAGGTDEGLDVVAELLMLSRLGPWSAPRAIATEMNITIPVEDPEAALEAVKAGLPELAARVVELSRERALTVLDEQFAQRLADGARDRTLLDCRARAHSMSLRYPMVAATEEQRSADAYEQTTAQGWRLCLMSLAASECGVPDSWTFPFEEHPAVERAMQILGAISTATADEIEAHRPHFRLAPADEEAAHRVAAAAGLRVRASMTTAFQESDLELSPADAADTVERMLAEKKPNLWHPAIALAAQEQLGVIGMHPIILRAEELIPGLPTTYDVLIAERAMSPARAAREYAEAIELQADLVAVTLPGLGGGRQPLPPNCPTTMQPAYLQVRHLGGHPGLSAGRKKLWLQLDCSVEATVFADPLARREVATLEWSKVSALEVAGPDIIGSRVTVPRLAAGGVFAFAFKKEQKRAYLIFRTHAGSDVTFEVAGKSTWELEAQLSPLLKWINLPTN